MKTIEEVKEYALKNYKQTFTKREIESRHPRTGVAKYRTVTVDPIVTDCGDHWTVSNHVDASPIILSKKI